MVAMETATTAVELQISEGTEGKKKESLGHVGRGENAQENLFNDSYVYRIEPSVETKIPRKTPLSAAELMQNCDLRVLTIDSFYKKERFACFVFDSVFRCLDF